MKYRIIFWGIHHIATKLFTLQKKVVSIMMGIKSHNPYRLLFKTLLISALSKARAMQTYSVNTRHMHCLHKPPANLSCFQKSAYYAGIKVFKNLPSGLNSLIN
jgi:hypothetical protein